MKLLDRYLMMQFTKNLLLVFCSLLTIYLLVDFFERIDNFMAAKKTVSMAIQYLLLKIPLIYEQLLPVCILLAGVITLGVLNHHFEFMALMAGGISVTRIIRPMLVAAAFFTLLAGALGQWVLPATVSKTNKMWYEEVNNKIPKGIIRNGHTYFQGESGIFSFKRANPTINEFTNFTFTALNDQYSLQTLLTAQKAWWTEGKWVFAQGQYKTLQPNGTYAARNFQQTSINFAERPDDFFMPPYKIQENSYSDLWLTATSGSTIDHLSWLEFNRRFSYIFLGFPLLLMGLPVLLTVHKTKGSDLALAIPVSCIMAFAAWGGWSATQAMAKAAYLSPGIASWAIHLVAGGLGFFLIRSHNR
ncbi:MAG: LptF/LptG family permease [Desulfobulbaceae bacterium]|nr:LptF/LptG family permease [Desulfobulbaceae bacterium]HIJ78671.1 YjgP/YjgQ family permease [Deltaproteobacteria bacterium]